MNHLKHLENVHVYKPGKPIDEVKRKLGLEEVIKLASNENPFGCSLFVKKAIERETLNVNRYPDGGVYYLRKELSKFLAVDKDEIIFGNGSNEVLDMIARAFLKEGDEVLIFQYSFIVYRIVSLIQGATIKEVPVEKDFSRNLNKLLENISSKTKIIFIDNPCNPTGVANLKDEFDNFIINLPEDILLVIDEAYFEYAKLHGVPNGINYVKPINPKVPKKNVIITRTFSKAYGLSGLRIGYGIADKEIIKILERVRQPFNTNHLAQIGAIQALKDQKFVEYSVSQNEIGKEYLYEELEKLNIHFIPSFANFVMFKSPVNNLYTELLKKGIAIRPAFGVDGYYRVSVGTMEENKKFISALRKII